MLLHRVLVVVLFVNEIHSVLAAIAALLQVPLFGYPLSVLVVVLFVNEIHSRLATVVAVVALAGCRR